MRNTPDANIPPPKAELPDVFNPQGFSARALEDVYWVVIWICVFIFIVVLAMVLWALIKDRDPTGKGIGKPIFGSTKIEITWTAIPVVIVAGIFVISVAGAEASDPAPPSGKSAHALAQAGGSLAAGERARLPDEPEPDRFDIIVTGHQWWWEFEYPDHGFWTANEMHIPQGKKLFLKIRSADVIHDFWVPQLARKIDAVPGDWDNHLWIEADRTGWFHGICAEYCGNQHAWMRFDVVSETQEEFDAWVANQKKDAPKPKSAMEREGFGVFVNNTCGNCHTLKGTEFDARIGPDLTHLMSRKYLGSGVLELNHENLWHWMKDAQAIKEGCHMPNFQFKDHEVDKITAYLENLK